MLHRRGRWQAVSRDYRLCVRERRERSDSRRTRSILQRDPCLMAARAYDVAIAGGGIVGAACAAECASAGLKVFVAEPGPIGGGATAAGMGHIVVMDDSPAQIALTNYSRTLWMQLAPQLPADVEYVSAGTLWVAADAEEMEEVHRKRSIYESIGVRAAALGPEELAEAEPNLRAGLAGALLVPDDAVIYPPCGA